MGRDAATHWVQHYRAVLVATAVRALRDRLPAAHGFAPDAGPRAWLADGPDRAGWRAVAVEAGAIAGEASLP